ncbi:hypothetical protein T440DRAFT_470651 [Plenodomus tracheiphilus IPT5]|uniref:Uncharacterized protein n=1 Tax=Plenodomus tracheiphilus IPT5 TaxID=1408161 RepID=A0A6A7AX54_9PLEO|nr:hypothetical protein T440DRAFT_470651 [Plenodomus tracheiphilus IPT5]
MAITEVRLSRPLTSLWSSKRLCLWADREPISPALHTQANTPHTRPIATMAEVPKELRPSPVHIPRDPDLPSYTPTQAPPTYQTTLDVSSASTNQPSGPHASSSSSSKTSTTSRWQRLKDDKEE